MKNIAAMPPYFLLFNYSLEAMLQLILCLLAAKAITGFPVHSATSSSAPPAGLSLFLDFDG